MKLIGLLKIFAWIASLVMGMIKSAPVPPPEPAPVPGPQPITTVAHAVLQAIEEHEATHPLIQRTVAWFDELLIRHGEKLMIAIEIKVLTVLAFKYPVIAPLFAQIVAQHREKK